jgi:hypothetical protein
MGQDDLNMEDGVNESPAPKSTPSHNQSKSKPQNTEVKKGGNENAEIAALKKQLEASEKKFNDFKSETAALIEKTVRESLAAMKPSPSADGVTDAIDEDDYDEEGKYYFSYRAATCLTGYMKNGKIFNNPMADIDRETGIPKATLFMYMGHKTSGVGDIKEQQSIVLCHYCSRSKKEQAWIEGHPEYRGGVIFSDVRRATNATSDKAARAAVAARMLSIANTWTPSQVAAKARQAGIEVGTDVEWMRMELVDKMVGDELSTAEQMSKRIARDNTRDGLFDMGDGSVGSKKTHANA